MLSSSRERGLIHLICRCAGDKKFWPDFLARLAAAMHATHAILAIEVPKSSRPGIAAFVGVNPRSIRKFKDSFCKSCQAKPCRVNVLGNSVKLENLILDSKRACLGVPRVSSRKRMHTQSLRFLKSDFYEAKVNVFRPRGASRFGAKDLSLLRSLALYLECAAETNISIAHLLNEKDAAWETLDRIPIGVIVLDSKGKILAMNQSGRLIVEQNDGVYISRDALFAARSDETEALYQRITATEKDTGVLNLTRPSGRRPLSLAVASIQSPQHFLQQSRPSSVVFISDPEHAMEIKANALQQFYELTPAEARLASLLTQGRNMKTAARDLNITYTSARNHLKHVFAKTGTASQSQLIRLLLSSPAAVHLSNY